MGLPSIRVYGCAWCIDCRRVKMFFDEHRVLYDWIDLDKDDESRQLVEEMHQGKRRVPTIVFHDGSVLVEPSDDELAGKLGLKP